MLRVRGFSKSKARKPPKPERFLRVFGTGAFRLLGGSGFRLGTGGGGGPTPGVEGVRNALRLAAWSLNIGAVIHPSYSRATC